MQTSQSNINFASDSTEFVKSKAKKHMQHMQKQYCLFKQTEQQNKNKRPWHSAPYLKKLCKPLYNHGG